MADPVFRRDLRRAVTAPRASRTENLGAGTDADALEVNASGQWNVGTPAYCRIRISPGGQAEAGTPYYRFCIAHEVFHCYEFDLMPGWATGPTG